jgi:hypothetical protein
MNAKPLSTIIAASVLLVASSAIPSSAFERGTVHRNGAVYHHGKTFVGPRGGVHRSSSGGRRSRTNTVIRTANTVPENPLSRSGVALAWSKVIPLTMRCRRAG